ncbi:MAG: hypothetical protein ABS951_04080 [Solibacillus sp.]
MLYTDATNLDIHVMKLDQNRMIVWDSKLANVNTTKGVQLTESANGDYLLGINGSGIQNADVILSRVNATGQVIQMKTFGSPQSDPYAYGAEEIAGMVETKNGDIFVYGSNTLKNNNVYSNQRNWVAKLDSSFTMK